MIMHSTWAQDLAREQLDGAREARKAESVRKLQVAKRAAAVELAKLKELAEGVAASDTSFEDIEACSQRLATESNERSVRTD